MNFMKNIRIHPLGDHALTIQLSENIDDDMHSFILQIVKQIEKNPFSGFIEVIPSYHNFTLFYDPYRVFTIYKNEPAFSPFQFVKNYCIDQMKQITLSSTREKN